MKRTILMLLMILVTVSASASGLLLTCDVGGAKLELYDDYNHVWKNKGTFPHLFTVDQYSYLLVRVSAEGYKEVEQGFDVRDPGTVRVNMLLEREDSNPSTTPMFALGGFVTSKRGLAIIPGMYTLMARNVTTYKTGVSGQNAQDTNPVDVGGYYTLTFADIANNRAVAVGDRIFVGAYNLSKTQCYGCVYFTATQDDVNNGCRIVNVTVK